MPTAHLVKRICADGPDFVKDEVPLGKTYEVSMPPVSMRWGRERDGRMVVTHRLSVFATTAESRGWMPFELFDLSYPDHEFDT